MNIIKKYALAVICVFTFAGVAAAQTATSATGVADAKPAKLTHAERSAAKKQIDADENMAMVECKKMSGAEKRACKKEAEAKEKTAKAELKTK